MLNEDEGNSELAAAEMLLKCLKSVDGDSQKSKNRWRNDLEYHNKKSFLSQANKIFKCGQGLSNIEERLEKPLCM
ncbi:1843_t:CDS:2, partial [Rhizophagus irregularis]